MYRPVLRPFGLRLLFAPAAGLALVLAGSAAQAFDYGDNETVIGTFDLTDQDRDVPRARSENRRKPAPLERAARRDADSFEIETLYHDAIDDLEAGENASAQRLLEQLIARAPDSDYAAQARRHLSELYAGLGKSQQPSLQPVRATAPEIEPIVQPGQPQSRMPMPAAVQSERWVSAETEMKFILDAGDRVFFSAGSADLGTRARAVLAAQARWLNAHDGVGVTVAGHADDAPLSEDQQQTLASARAEAVRQRLIDEGVETGRIIVIASGRTHRLSDCDLPECTAQNRRVETQLSERPAARADGQNRVPVAAGNTGFQAR